MINICGLIVLLLSLVSVPCWAEKLPQVIQDISRDLENTKDDHGKSQLYIFRARQYARIQKWDNALEDYNRALETNHKGWIHLERSRFLLGAKQYELAYEDAKAAKKETPTLAEEADSVIDKAVAEIRKQYEADNPQIIIMNTKVDPHRKTRFDIMREQGVFTAKSRQNDAFNEQRKSKRKQSRKSSYPPKKTSRRG